MGKNNSREAKAARRKLNYLKKITTEYNQTKYRMIDGQLYPYRLVPRSFVKEYEAGELQVEEIAHNKFIIKDREGVKINMDENANTQAPATPAEPTAPQAPSEPQAPSNGDGGVAEQPAQPEAPATPTAPETTATPEASTPASGEEVPGQAPAVEKTQIPVPDVSTTGEKTE